MTTGIGAGMGRPGAGQSTEDAWIESEETRTIEEDLQSGTITQTFLVPGRPDEAYNNQHVSELDITNVHPFYRHSYLIKRRLESHVNRGQEANRLTKVTTTHQRRPCPLYPELSCTMSLTSMNTWWSYSDPPVNHDHSKAGFPVLVPQSFLAMRWPSIDMSLVNLLDIRRLGGHLMQAWDDTREGGKPRSFFGENCRDMLFQGMNYNHLWGPANFSPDSGSRWEMSLHFHIDPLRHHQKWEAIFDMNRDPSEEEPGGHAGTGKPIHVATLADLIAGTGHKRYVVRPAVTDFDWDTTFGGLVASADEVSGHGDCTSDEENQIGPVL